MDVVETNNDTFPLGREGVSRNMKRILSQLSKGKIASMEGDGNAAQNPYAMWYEIACQYSKRNLTQANDRLPALDALAKYFEVLTGDEYYAGLWNKDLLYGLLWSHILHQTP